MPAEGRLTKKGIDALQPKALKYKLRDSDGLFMCVYPSGVKKWIVSVYVDGKAREQSIGGYPELSPAAARKERTRIKDERERAGNAAALTLGDLCARWTQDYSAGCAPATQYNHRLYISYMKPLLPLRIMDLKRVTIMGVLEQVRREKSYDAAYRTATCLSQMLQHAVNLGFLEYNPARDIGAAITATREERRGKHFESITDVDGIKKLLNALEYIRYAKPVEYLFLKLISCTFVRSGELRLATWSDIDLEHKV